MPKSNKKRRRNGDGSLSSSDKVVVASLKTSGGVDSVESCLAEMSGSVALAPLAPSFSSTITADQQQHHHPTELCDPTLSTPFAWSDEKKARITTWNRAMRLWQTSGTYTPGLLPSFDVELARHFKVQALSAYLLEECKDLKMPAFERWLIDSKLEEREREGVASNDPVLSNVSIEFGSSQRLLEEVREAGLERNNAKKLVKDLCHRTTTALREVVLQQNLHDGRTPLKKGDRIDLEGHEPVYTLVYHRKKWKKPFCIKINSAHYEKLKHMFLRVHGQAGQPVRLSEAGKTTKATHAFHLLLMVLLLRYSSLSGGQLLLDLRGGGMQGAVHGQVFRVLHEFFSHGPLLESFGSPLNAYLSAFGSAFPEDLDWHFGSIGNFLSETIVAGCCEANPPFSPGMMTAMAERIEQNLAEADKKKTSLTFVVIVPSAGDDQDVQRAAAKRFGGIALKQMTTSDSCRHHILLSAKEHGYIEGAQHMRPTRYKESLYDTSVVILQSKRARRLELDKVGLEEKIREAFASRHREEVEKRKQNREDSNTAVDASVNKLRS